MAKGKKRVIIFKYLVIPDCLALFAMLSVVQPYNLILMMFEYFLALQPCSGSLWSAILFSCCGICSVSQFTVHPGRGGGHLLSGPEAKGKAEPELSRSRFRLRWYGESACSFAKRFKLPPSSPLPTLRRSWVAASSGKVFRFTYQTYKARATRYPLPPLFSCDINMSCVCPVLLLLLLLMPVVIVNANLFWF